MVAEWVELIGYGTLTGLAFILIPRLLLCCCGFTCCGVRKSSYASGWQSRLGYVEVGSEFANFQSAGAGGTPCGTQVGIFLFGCYLTVALIIASRLGHTTIEPTDLTTYPPDYTMNITNPTIPTNFISHESTTSEIYPPDFASQETTNSKIYPTDVRPQEPTNSETYLPYINSQESTNSKISPTDVRSQEATNSEIYQPEFSSHE